MEELEPWNMFTNDFVAEETDPEQLLADANAIIGEYAKEETEKNGNDKNNGNEDGESEDDSNLLIPEVTMGGDGGGGIGDVGEQSNSNGHNAPGEEDDNAIFNFDVTPSSASSEKIKRTAMLAAAKDNTFSRKELESLINYDNAIIYICPACGCEFDTQEVWKRHINGIHNFNTRRGLNFVQIDKLYHECLACHKHIAMHSMENLLKHKYTHLPYRCAKCKFCMRQYKYRQDLTVHLRTQHNQELVKMARAAKEELNRTAANGQRSAAANNRSLEIRDIRENAIDAFGNNDSSVRVKNEIMDAEDNDMDESAEQSSSSLMVPSFLEDALSRASSKNSEQQSNGSGGGGKGESSTTCEKQIQYICPDCGQEYGTQSQWQNHIISVHNFGTRQGLNFEEINYNRQARCLECQEILPQNGIHHMQQHKFTHLPHKAWLRCKLCFKTFTGRTEILKHLTTQHTFDIENRNKDRGGGGDNDIDDSQDGDWDNDDSLLQETQSIPTKEHTSEDRDTFDAHIDYMCPTCGKEFRIKKLWRKHIVQVHKLTTLEILNFKNLNEREVMCLECGKVITNAYGIQNAQQHYFTHMPFKSFIRCRLCGKSYTDRKGLVKHLRGKHFGRQKSLNISSTPKPYFQPSKPAAATPQQPQRSQPTPQQNSSNSQLLSQALQRPLRTDAEDSSNSMPPTKRLRQSRPKEIVTHKNFVFEIEFLDDDDDVECDNEVGLVNAAAGDDDDDNDDDEVLLVPDISGQQQSNNNNSGRQPSFSRRERCADCGSIFSTTEALRAHIRKEHDFYDRPGGQYGHSTPKETAANNDDDDALLVPSGAENVEYGNSSTPWSKSNTNEVERHFTYLCPSCGVEHYTQMDWRRHINSVHNFDKREYLNFRYLDQYRYQCTICQDIVTKSKLKALQDHKFRHLPYKSYLKCKYCGTLYNHKPNMYGHLQVRHKISVSRPLANDYAANDDYTPPRKQPASSSAPHSRHNSGNNRYSMSYATPPSSMAATHSVKNSNTSGGNASSLPKPPGLKTVEDVITYHNAVDHATITYFCPSCNENFDSHVFWRKHIVEEHNLNSKDGLNFRQIDEHHFLCLQCYKRVTVTHTKGAIGQLQSHKFRHLPYRSFKCLNCNGEFVRKQMFFKHLNRATNRCESATQIIPQTDDQDGVSKTAAATSDKSPRNGNLDDTAGDDQHDNSTINASLIVNQDAFVLVCPQCGDEFESQRYWREHINIEHKLGKREKLRFKKINPHQHTCLECGERVNGRKLRDLQIHRFKHLPFGPYIQCKFCQTGYNHIRNMQDHLRQRHPNVVQKHDEYAKMEEMRMYEESSLTDADAESVGGSSVVNEAEIDEEDADQVEVIPDIEEGEDDEQYLLG